MGCGMSIAEKLIVAEKEKAAALLQASTSIAAEKEKAAALLIADLRLQLVSVLAEKKKAETVAFQSTARERETKALLVGMATRSHPPTHRRLLDTTAHTQVTYAAAPQPPARLVPAATAPSTHTRPAILSGVEDAPAATQQQQSLSQQLRVHQLRIDRQQQKHDTELAAQVAHARELSSQLQALQAVQKQEHHVVQQSAPVAAPLALGQATDPPRMQKAKQQSPSVEQSHPIVAPSTAAAMPKASIASGSWSEPHAQPEGPKVATVSDVVIPDREPEHDFFLSHYQATGGDQVMTLDFRLTALGFVAWFDQKASSITTETMGEGVRSTKVFLLFLSEGVLTRPFVLFEVKTAIGLAKSIVLMHGGNPFPVAPP